MSILEWLTTDEVVAIQRREPFGPRFSHYNGGHEIWDNRGPRLYYILEGSTLLCAWDPEAKVWIFNGVLLDKGRKTSLAIHRWLSAIENSVTHIGNWGAIHNGGYIGLVRDRLGLDDEHP